MYTIFSAVQRQQRKSDVMTSFGLTACSAVYYHAGSTFLIPHYLSFKVLFKYAFWFLRPQSFPDGCPAWPTDLIPWTS
jgi:hypothetical protein